MLGLPQSGGLPYACNTREGRTALTAAALLALYAKLFEGSRSTPKVPCTSRRMAAQVDDLCLVCADPLEWTAFGPCGHNEVCSRCVARMRFVLKEPGCVFCRQESPAVFFTRFMGDYTKRVAPEEFAELQV